MKNTYNSKPRALVIGSADRKVIEHLAQEGYAVYSASPRAMTPKGVIEQMAPYNNAETMAVLDHTHRKSDSIMRALRRVGITTIHTLDDFASIMSSPVPVSG